MHVRTASESPRNTWVNLALTAILLSALALRLTGVDWDGFYHVHPDERYIVWVGTTVDFPTDWSIALDPQRSTFNPFYWPPEAKSSGIQVQQAEPRSFAYGHWPLYLGVAAAHLLDNGDAARAERFSWIPQRWTLVRDLLNFPGRIEYNHLLVVGRTLAALADTLTIWLIFRLGRRLFGPVAGLLAAALLGFSVLHIQSAHFFISDPFLATAVVAAVCGMVRRAQSGRFRDSLLAGAGIGLAVGAKFSAVLLILPLLALLFWGRRVPPVARWSGLQRKLGRWYRWGGRPIGELLVALLAALAVFALTNPFAMLDTTCTDALPGFRIPFLNLAVGPFTIHSCYLKNIGTQGVMVRGSANIPFTLQYQGTTPYLYFVEQMARWGLGLPLTLALLAGLVWAVMRMVQRRAELDEMVVMAWVLPFLVVTGSFQVKFLRYLLPLVPFLTLYAGAMIAEWVNPEAASRPEGAATGAKRRAFGWATMIITLGGSAVWSLAFVGLYGAAEHPWVAASKWLYANAPARSALATEHWDHSLPLRLRTEDGGGESGRFREVELEWFDVEDRLDDPDNGVALGDALERVAESDYLVLASNRLYGVIPRLSSRYPEAAAYYRLLMSGELGFDLAYWAGRYPTVGTLAAVDDTFAWPGLTRPAALEGWQPAPVTMDLGPADESFTVYDHPFVLIFENADRLSAAELEARVRAAASE